MGPLALIGLLIAGGAAMLPLLGDSEDEMTDGAANDQDVEGSDAAEVQPDQVLQIGEDVPSDQEDDSSDDQRESVTNFNVILNTLNDAEWNSEEEAVLSASEFQNLTDNPEGPVTVRDGAEANRIDASETEHGLFYLGEGDVLVGSDVSDELYDIVAIAQGAAMVEGGASEEVLIANGDGADIEGGGGNDLIISGEGSSTLSGGEGDDRIIGNGENLLAPTGGVLLDYLLNDGPDYIDGGTGDDYIRASTGDTVLGGTGADEIKIIGGNADVLDFETGIDVIKLALSDGAINVDPETHESYNLDNRISLTREGEELTIQVDGEEVLSLNCSEATTVGYINGIGNTPPEFLTQHEADETMPDILIYVELQYTS